MLPRRQSCRPIMRGAFASPRAWFWANAGLMSPEPANFYSRTSGARKIIVVDLGFLGDSVQLVPALWELKRNYPHAKLHTLSATVGAELLRLVPCVDRAWAFPLAAPSPPWWRHWNLL